MNKLFVLIVMALVCAAGAGAAPRDAEWKKVVTDQMQTARLVVIRAGASGGLLWEVKEVVQVVNPKKLLILILNMRKKDYESFIKKILLEKTF